MIRKEFVNRRVLDIYRKLPEIKFPIRLKEIIDQIPNCRLMSYEELSEITGTTVQDIIDICESESGCTHYDPSKDRYLILCNQDMKYNSIRRQRWTCGHEIGHVICNHNSIALVSHISENGTSDSIDAEMEREADYFAATLLSPFPFFRELGINTYTDVMNTFGLSCESAKYRMAEYNEWIKTHRKTSWENDMLRLFRDKYKA